MIISARPLTVEEKRMSSVEEMLASEREPAVVDDIDLGEVRDEKAINEVRGRIQEAVALLMKIGIND